MDINGNSVSEDVLDALAEKIKMNLKRNPIPREEIVWQGERVEGGEEGDQDAPGGGEEGGSLRRTGGGGARRQAQ